MSTAILIDAAFFLHRSKHVFNGLDYNDPMKMAEKMHSYAFCHLQEKKNHKPHRRDLYRIFIYDCPPLELKIHHPITNRMIDFQKVKSAAFRARFHDELKKKRSVALRLGHVETNKAWNLTKAKMKDVLSGKVEIKDLLEEDIYLEMRQKGVDIKIGIDIASLAYKGLVDQIVLISGDSDFVPAAKLARREGIDFILDPLWNPISPGLFEHIDGLKTYSTDPKKTSNKKTTSKEKGTKKRAIPKT